MLSSMAHSDLEGNESVVKSIVFGPKAALLKEKLGSFEFVQIDLVQKNELNACGGMTSNL